MELQYIGHSAFYIKTKNAGILIDPAISDNPLAKFDPNSQIDDILVTHGHADHLGDAIPIAKKTGATITTVHELALFCSKRGAKAQGGNIGGKITFSWGNVRFVNALHSSSTVDGAYAGGPVGFIIEAEGTKIYHAGDTGIFRDMKTIGELYAPDIVLLPVGSTYTMDIEEAVVAAQWLKAKKLIPMHYNTFPPIAIEIQELKDKLPKDIELLALKPGESIQL
ncbi:MAG: metal-dependent hydrolase [Candidatus Gastranaerophilales bacterium]|nr:metal-dependent hydrolase [Candidatus Gastranaerophilales bacterium]